MKTIGRNFATIMVVIAGFGAMPANAQSEQTPPVEMADVVKSYADLALAGYEDALRTARELRSAIETLLGDPSPDNLETARTAWKTARIPYQQTEVFRFASPIVEAWQGRVNGAPLDEGFIDYVDAAYGTQNENNALYAANVIASTQLVIDGEPVSIAQITPSLIADTLNEAGGIKTNVASGYHVIEFLLWGQDLNGTGEGAGVRPATDFDLDKCTNGNCARRSEYLFAVSDLLVSDLQEMVSNWNVTGAARRAVTSDPQKGLYAILQGMADLSYSELAGQRLKLPLLMNEPEFELDDFSDYTHASQLFDARGVVNVYFGEYFAIDGTTFSGASLADLVKQADETLDIEVRIRLGITMARIRLIVDRVQDAEAFDQMIGVGNTRGRGLIEAAIDALIAQTQTIRQISTTLGLGPLEVTASEIL